MRTLNHLAVRLGVRPVDEDQYCVFAILGPDGIRYDWIELIHGFLDFIEKKGASGDLHRLGDSITR